MTFVGSLLSLLLATTLVSALWHEDADIRLSLIGRLNKGRCVPLIAGDAILAVNERNATFCPAIGDLSPIGDANYFNMTLSPFDHMGTKTSAILAALKVTGVMPWPDWSTTKMKPVHGNIGFAWSSITMSAAPILDLVKVPTVGYSATSAKLSNKANFPNFYRATVPDSEKMRVVVQFFASIGITNVVAVYDDDDFSGSMMQSLKDGAQELYGSNFIVSTLLVPIADILNADSSALHTKLDLLSTDNDYVATKSYVLCTLWGEEFVTKIRQYGMMGKDRIWLAPEPLNKDLAGTDVSGTLTLSPAAGISAADPVKLAQMEEHYSRWSDPGNLVEQYYGNSTDFWGIGHDQSGPTAGPLYGGVYGMETIFQPVKHSFESCSAYREATYDAVVLYAVAYDSCLRDGTITDRSAVDGQMMQTCLKRLRFGASDPNEVRIKADDGSVVPNSGSANQPAYSRCFSPSAMKWDKNHDRQGVWEMWVYQGVMGLFTLNLFGQVDSVNGLTFKQPQAQNVYWSDDYSGNKAGVDMSLAHQNTRTSAL